MDGLKELVVSFTASSLSTLLRDGNEGMDLSINFRPPFRLGEKPTPLEGEILFPLGEEVFITLLGEPFSFRMFAVSSSQKLLTWFSNLLQRSMASDLRRA